MHLHKVSIIAILVAICVATNYALVGVPNVKVMDFLVFITGFCFGPVIGILTGILGWAVYGAMNPYGFILQVWLATMFSESIYGLLGGLVGKTLALTNFSDERIKLSIFFGSMGLISTFIYDIITNVVYASAFGIPFIVAFVIGAPLTILHEVGNAAIFGVISIPVIVAFEQLLGGERFGVSKK
jgi:uncharacterized membrane protein